MGFKILGLLDLGSQIFEACKNFLTGVLAPIKELPYGVEYLRMRLDLLEISDWWRARQFHRLDAKTVAASRALLLTELHVP